MDAKQTMYGAYLHGMRFSMSSCADPDCVNCGDDVEVMACDAPPDSLLDAMACHMPSIIGLLKANVYRETRH